MKNVLSSLFISLLTVIIAILVYHNYNQQKVGIIDSNRLLNEYKGTKAVLSELEEKSKVWKANLDTLTVEFQNEIKKFEKDRISMSDKEIQLSQELLRNKQNQIAQYQQVTEQKIKEEDQKVSQGLYGHVNQIISEYGKENRFKFILGAKGDGGVLYGEESIDITDELIEILNSNE